MASSPTEFVAAADGARLAWRALGEGRPVLMIHGYFSTAQVNWIKFGHAALLAGRGFRVIMPDLRGHGESDKPHDPAFWPPDVLADDGFRIVEALGLVDYDLVGYSLGARTAVRMMARGARPRRAVLAGMGLDGILHTAGRGGYFRRVLTNLGRFERGSSEWLTEAFLKTTGGDPQALLAVLDSFVDTEREAVAGIAVPTLVLAGEQDYDNGPAAALAEVMPNARFEAVPGNHMSAVTRPELGRAIADFLAA